MIISHRLKFAFFRVPKTGSTTAELLLRLCGVFDERDLMTPILGLSSTVPESVRAAAEQTVRRVARETGRNQDTNFEKRIHHQINSQLMHMTPKDAIKRGVITLEQLREYRVFAFVREPWDRHFSGLSYSFRAMLTPEVFKRAVRNRLIPRPEGHIVMRPSTQFFFVDGEQVTEPLDFADFDNEVRRVIAQVGGVDFPVVPRLNAGLHSRSQINKVDYYDAETEQIVREQLAGDLQFYAQWRGGGDAQ